MSKCTPTNRVNHLLRTPGTLTDFDSLLGQFFGPSSRALSTPSGWQAPASLYEADDRLHVELDAPGVASENVEVTFENGRLAVSLDRPKAEDAPEYVYNERRFGKVVRTLDLPDTVDPDSIEAQLTDGVLRVSIAKRPETQPRKIEIKRG